MPFLKRKESPDEKMEKYSDLPLNYYADQVPDINPQLRRLDLQWLGESALENLTLISSALLLGTAVGFLFKRKVAIASYLALGFVLQQTVLGGRISRFRRSIREQRKDIELERRALKAQRGDYGKLEVIAFK
ncbi:MAG TPA: hypothetical protein VJ604_02960 [Geomonas sp.]|nr:hypothetical protein [Geomonas sp.]